jgi:hypothetical protein
VRSAGADRPAGTGRRHRRSAVADLDVRVSELEDSIGTLQDDLATLQDEAGSSTLEVDVADAATKLSDLCDAFSLYRGAFSDIYLSAC